MKLKPKRLTKVRYIELYFINCATTEFYNKYKVCSFKHKQYRDFINHLK